MTRLADLMDLGLLAEMIEHKTIRTFHHPSGDLVGYHYTERAQWERIWNDATLNCRGLIADVEGNVISRPFPKFFNLGDDPEQDNAYTAFLPVLYEKVDGSLGVTYTWKGETSIATKGSFTSPQAEWATEWHRSNGVSAPSQGETDLFEIVYPENRIIVDYEGRAELVHLARLRNATAARVPARPNQVRFCRSFGRRSHLTAAADHAEMDTGNFEGFVAEWADGHRVKIKLAEYLRLHRIMASTSNKTIWEALSSGTSIETMLEATPDEFQQWVLGEFNSLKGSFAAIEKAARRAFAGLDASGGRAEFAAQAKATEWPSVMFSMLDGKDYAPLIWRMVKPASIEYPQMGRGEAAA